MTPDEIVARARSAIGRPTVYKLGKGGRKPDAPHPADANGQCDCSGAVAWFLGLDRYQPGKVSGDWLSTSSMVREATAGRLFRVVVDPEPGDVVVYGDYVKDGIRRQGHCGIVVAAPAQCLPDVWSSIRVVHCSSGNSKRGDAIQETDAKVFKARGIFARLVV